MRVITAWVSALVVPFLKNSPWCSSVLFFSNPQSTVQCYFWPGTLPSSILRIKRNKTWDSPNWEFPFSSVYSWSRGSTPFTALNVGRRGWRSCPCPTLRPHLWEVRVLFIPFIRRPDKRINIYVSATHVESSPRPSHDTSVFVNLLSELWKSLLSCLPPDDNSESESDSDDRFKGEWSQPRLTRGRRYSRGCFSHCLCCRYVITAWHCTKSQTKAFLLKHFPSLSVNSISTFSERNESQTFSETFPVFWTRSCSMCDSQLAET